MRCRYWVCIQKPMSPHAKHIHVLARENKYSQGWSGIYAQCSKDHVIQKQGPFDTRKSVQEFYWANKANFPGGLAARTLDFTEQSMPGGCDDQVQ